MFPVWFFILLVVFICYLLYATRITEEDILKKNNEPLNGVPFWANEEG